MIGTSRSGSSLFITYSSTNHRIRSGISAYAESRTIGRVGFAFQGIQPVSAKAVAIGDKHSLATASWDFHFAMTECR